MSCSLSVEPFFEILAALCLILSKLFLGHVSQNICLGSSRYSCRSEQAYLELRSGLIWGRLSLLRAVATWLVVKQDLQLQCHKIF